MKEFWYRKKMKVGICLLQGILAAVIVFGMVMIGRFRTQDQPLGEVGRAFEHTGIFYQTVETIIREKVGFDQDRMLFETEGVFNPDKVIDVRQYVSGMLDDLSANAATSYTLQDLLSFGENGADKMQERISSLLSDSYDDTEAGSRLLKLSGELELVLPVSGTSLADFAARSANPGVAVLEYDRNLCETALDIKRRYDSYQAALKSAASSLAPSNVAYYIENTAQHIYFSNFGATSLLGAEELVFEREDLTFLFEGERRYNIMVSNPERILNEYAADYFMQVSFLSSGEKVLIAVDLSYPVGDALGQAWKEYQRRVPYLITAIVCIALSAALLIGLLILSVITAGRGEKGGKTLPMTFDRIPTEIAMGICLIAGSFWWIFAMSILRAHRYNSYLRLFGRPALAGGIYLIGLMALLSLVRRYRSGLLWENSVLYYVLLGTRQVYSARKSSQRLVIAYLGFVVLNMLFLLIGSVPGVVMALVLNFAALIYLMRDVVGNQNVREGLHQISKGKLDYRINTDVLTGESREMGAAVNEMGEGLEKAVESMLQGERMKAELITNVSHDLKTPLTSIINYVDLLRRLNLEDEKAREYLAILDQKSQRLKTLTEELIEAGRISSGNVEMHPAKLLLQQMIRQAVGEFEDRLEGRGITLCLDLCSEPAQVVVDGAALWRVFENLLGNMAKYAADNAPANLRLYLQGDTAVICISNQPAIPITASAAQLLERFGRGDASRTDSEGFGLGLSIAQSLTALMGGNFSLRVTPRLFEVQLTFPLFCEKSPVDAEHDG